MRQEPPARLGGWPRHEAVRLTSPASPALPRASGWGPAGPHGCRRAAPVWRRSPGYSLRAAVTVQWEARQEGGGARGSGPRNAPETGWQDRMRREKGRQVEKTPGSLPNHQGGESRTGASSRESGGLDFQLKPDAVCDGPQGPDCQPGLLGEVRHEEVRCSAASKLG